MKRRQISHDYARQAHDGLERPTVTEYRQRALRAHRDGDVLLARTLALVSNARARTRARQESIERSGR